MQNVDLFIELLPFLIPYFIIYFGLMIAALVHIFKHDHYKVGNRLIWIAVVVLLQVIGPILYFIVGKTDRMKEEY